MSEPTRTATTPAVVSHDVCALPLAWRLAAMLDRAPERLHEGDPLPRGWHVMLFNTPTPQSRLRHDGAAGFGVALPDIGLPRLMLGGRQNRFIADIPLGARVRRESRPGEVQMKEGRSGRFALVTVEHRIFVEDEAEPAVIERQDYILREAAGAAPAPAVKPDGAMQPPPANPSDATRLLTPDEPLLFRYSAITDNPHRIHYDQPYATLTEGYRALVVNGSIPAMFLLELFRATAGREPITFDSRNVAPMYCGHPLRLHARNEGGDWRLWVRDHQGNLSFDARAR